MKVYTIEPNGNDWLLRIPKSRDRQRLPSKEVAIRAVRQIEDLSTAQIEERSDGGVNFYIAPFSVVMIYNWRTKEGARSHGLGIRRVSDDEASARVLLKAITREEAVESWHPKDNTDVLESVTIVLYEKDKELENGRRTISID